jgi:hypothetical protein
MRHLAAPLLVFLAVVPGACGPNLPGLDLAATPVDAGEATAVEAAGDRPRVTPPPDLAPPPPRPDAAAPDARPDLSPPDVRADVAALETRPDSGAVEARPETGAGEVRPEAGGRDAGAEVGPADAHLDAGPPGDAVPESAPDAPSARPPRAGEVRIVEVLVDPDGNDLGHEWFEIVNLTGEALSLADLHVADGATDVALGAGVLGPGARLVLGQSLDRAHNGDAPVDASYGTKLALNNDADRITICVGVCAAGVVVDAFEWTEAWGAAFVGHAIVVEPATGATCPATEPYGTGGNFGTPGAPNLPCMIGLSPRG